MLRTFIAIELPDNVRDLLAGQIRNLRQELPNSFKWAKPESIHLTLKFLGETREDQVPDIVEAVQKAAADVQAFDLRTGDPGCFPNTKRPRVIWVGVEGELDRLASFQKEVEEACRKLGFEPDDRRFVPHLTFARANNRGSKPGPIQLDQVSKGVESFTVTGVSLMRSDLTPQGAAYTRLAFVELSQNALE